MEPIVDPVFKDVVYSNKNYDVQIVKLADMAFETYCVRNKEHGIIEHVQANKTQAIKIADEFNKWLENPSQPDPLDFRGSFLPGLEN